MSCYLSLFVSFARTFYRRIFSVCNYKKINKSIERIDPKYIDEPSIVAAITKSLSATPVEVRGD